MSILASGVRPRRRAAKTSIREVCLLGVGPEAPDLASGERVTFSGRVYRVEATGTRGGREEGAPRYVHLAPGGDGEG